MQIIGTSNTTFILLSGIAVQSDVKLSKHVELQPADTSHLDIETALSTCSRPDDIAVVMAFIPRITAQLHITAETPKNLATIAWNSSWDALLLSAIFHTEIGFSLQSDTTSGEITADSTLRATSLHMHGLVSGSPHILTSEEAKWVSTHFYDAQQMLENDSFQMAVHCLASYRWHSMPRIKMAVIWAGIEGIFGASSEIRFRISVYTARFLYPDETDARQTVFEAVKKLYNTRSQAVHGTKIKGDIATAVDESADILRKLLVRCIETKSMPNENDLVP
ncbi:MAG: hypothetical protein KUG81_04515 [Gammaproteobacteria bacterium]|nr:hypothetical protein [Gammaproteobacteria bacterium]